MKGWKIDTTQKAKKALYLKQYPFRIFTQGEYVSENVGSKQPEGKISMVLLK